MSDRLSQLADVEKSLLRELRKAQAAVEDLKVELVKVRDEKQAERERLLLARDGTNEGLQLRVMSMRDARMTDHDISERLKISVARVRRIYRDFRPFISTGSCTTSSTVPRTS